jgi:hypothetical protein
VKMVEWAADDRTSFWRLAWENVVLPLLPLRLYQMFGPPRARLAPWIGSQFAKRLDLASRAGGLGSARAPWGRKYESAVEDAVALLGFGYDSNIIFTSFDFRCPFFYRPLIEFSLQLPVLFRTRHRAHKWILREAMRGILPEKVRTRTGKGGADGRIDWSLTHETERIQWLLKDPIIAQLGWVDRRKLQQGVTDALGGDEFLRGAVLRALGLETWLRVRSGQWTTRGSLQYRHGDSELLAHTTLREII